MTLYVAAGPPSTEVETGAGPYTYTYDDTYQLSVTAGSTYVRIVKVERIFFSLGNTLPLNTPYAITQYIGTTVSGGNGSVTPSPLRSFGPAASATSRYARAHGVYSTNSNGYVFTSTPLSLSGGTNKVVRSENPIGTLPVQADYQFPADYIMGPGSTFVVSGLAVNGTSSASVYGIGYYAFRQISIFFEELHLARST